MEIDPYIPPDIPRWRVHAYYASVGALAALTAGAISLVCSGNGLGALGCAVGFVVVDALGSALIGGHP